MGITLYWIGVGISFIFIFIGLAAIPNLLFKDFHPILYIFLLFSFGSWYTIGILFVGVVIYVLYFFIVILIRSLINNNGMI